MWNGVNTFNWNVSNVWYLVQNQFGRPGRSCKATFKLSSPHFYCSEWMWCIPIRRVQFGFDLFMRFFLQFREIYYDDGGILYYLHCWLAVSTLKDLHKKKFNYPMIILQLILNFRYLLSYYRTEDELSYSPGNFQCILSIMLYW